MHNMTNQKQLVFFKYEKLQGLCIIFMLITSMRYPSALPLYV